MKASLSLDDVLGTLPQATGRLLNAVASVAATEGISLYLVGGPVRDLLLERPLVDVDLMVTGDARASRALADAVVEEMKSQASEEEGPFRIVPHDRFGTIRLEAGDASLDIAQARDERYAHPGALPEVSHGTLEQDMQRRDFGVNALYCPLDATDSGKRRAIIDPLGGLEDLAARKLRILHPRSFHDDPTRAFRAARFAARLGFSLDRRSRNALRDALRDGAFGSVSGERFRRELQFAFQEAEQGVSVGKVLRLLSDWHVLSALEPGLILAKDRVSPLRRLSKAIAEPEWTAPKWRPWIAGLSIWLAPLPAALRRRTLERFSIRGEQATRIVRFGRDAERILRGLMKARGRGAVDATLNELPEETVHALYAMAAVPVRRRMLRWAVEDRRRRSPVGGADMKEVGLTGPDVGRALTRIRAGFLDGEIANREEALALGIEMARRSARRASQPQKRPGGSARAKAKPAGRKDAAKPKKATSSSPKTKKSKGQLAAKTSSASRPGAPSAGQSAEANVARKGRRKVAQPSAITDTPGSRRRSLSTKKTDPSDSEDSPQAPRTDASR